MKSKVAWLTILMILACPFRCMGLLESQCQFSSEDAERHCCSFCESNGGSSLEDVTSPSDPLPNSDECDCKNCLCNVVLLSNRIQITDTSQGCSEGLCLSVHAFRSLDDGVQHCSMNIGAAEKNLSVFLLRGIRLCIAQMSLQI